MNDSFKTSKVKIIAEFAGAFDSGYLEPGNFQKDLEIFRKSPHISKRRDGLSADIVVTLVERLGFGDELCGLAYSNAGADYAYAIVSSEYLTKEGDCFAHEVAHIFGADHDLANAKASPFQYGHGYQYTPGIFDRNVSGSCFRTIMAY